ncbi:DMT family transporter [Bacteriovorax sp. Seq25_V]|uniref:DMT family transporter n=1 Tax=Bacteriovorax sp. Seq25_V TaxID=1201288 RepID=UPI00038A469A|nr:DMT family transporter [Bacteriovorax sp. Seq25_V]EQC45451.1 EamA-like transporter family protein [Bacteriovorax sp. Seq25_V]
MAGILLLSFACLIWGLGFAGTRFTFIDYSPLWSQGLRYLFAALIAIPILAYRRGFKEFKGAFFCSLFLTGAMITQTIGISMTTMAKAGFLTVFYAVFTPIISVIIFKQKLRKTFWALLALAMFGIFLMCDLKLDGFNMGDFYIVLCAIFFSGHIILTDIYAEKYDTINFNFLQCTMIGFISVVIALVFEGPVSLAPLINAKALIFPSSLYGFIILSIFSSLIAFSLQIYAQKKTPPHIVGLVFLSESIFASIFGYFFFDEKIGVKGGIGAVIILIAVALIPKFANIQKHPEQE